MTATLTQEQLRQFFQRASQAEELARALKVQIETIKQQAGMWNTQMKNKFLCCIAERSATNY